MGSFVQYNPNPSHLRVGDCAVRAISKALNQTWDEAYIGIVLQGYELCDMPSGNHIWGSYLRKHGFTRHLVPEELEPYTVAQFAKDHPKGTYVLALSGHVVCVKEGNWFDSWNSGDEVVIYYWSKEK